MADKPIKKEIEIPVHILEKWQRTVNSIADLGGVPAAVIMRVHAGDNYVLKSCESPDNPIRAGEKHPLAGSFCEKVIAENRRLLVPDAVREARWRHYSRIRPEIVSYAGFPLCWPDDEPFGTLCMFDFKENRVNSHIETMAGLYKELIEGDIQYLYHTRELERQIAKHKRAETELRQSEWSLRAMLNNSTAVVYLKDPEGRYLYVNRQYEILHDITLKEAVGITDYDIFPKERADAFRKNDREVLASGTSIEFEEIVPHAGGEYQSISIKFPIYNRSGGIYGICGISTDVTKRKEAEAEKHKLETQLMQDQKLKAVGVLAGGIAHDFNNLLMGIQGRVSLMEMKLGENDHRVSGDLKGIEQMVVRGAELTKQLLGFARGGKYEATPTNANDLIRKSAEMFGRTKKEIKIHKELGAKLYTIEIDPGQIEQVLLNLYVNAWQAMPQGGDLFIRTENITLDEYAVQAHKVSPGGFVKITISDTGVGMDRETQSRIFEPFFTTREVGKGTGLGLSSAYGIIKNHGGFINVYSEIGKGATFSIYLPASEKTANTDKSQPDKLLRGTETLLLVDDEEMIIDVGEGLLAALGYQVMTARNGKEAIRVYTENRNKISLVILDMIMPEMGGSETYTRLVDINPAIKVLLSSGYSEDTQAKELMGYGANGFIQKPFSMNRLSMKIREILDH